MTHARVTFTSEATGEFLFYDVKYTAGTPAPRGALALECPVRTQTVARVMVANPLPTDIALRTSITGSRQVGGSPSFPIARTGIAAACRSIAHSPHVATGRAEARCCSNPRR